MKPTSNRPHSLYLESMIYNTPASQVDLGGSSPPFPFGIGFFNDAKLNLQPTGLMPETAQLKELLAQKLLVEHQNLCLTVGSSMALTQSLAAITKTGDSILIEQPCYEPFISQSKFLGLKVKTFNRTGNEDEDFKTIKRRSRGVKVLLISNPHSPLGIRYSERFLEKTSGLFPFTVIDEVFEPLFSVGGNLSQIKGTQNPGLITLHSFSKSLGLGNIRLGVIRGSAEVIHNCNLQAMNFHVDPPNLSVIFGLHAMKNWDIILKNLEAKISLTRPIVQEFAADHPKALSHNLSRGFFAMLKVPREYKTGEKYSAQILKDTGVYMRPGKLFGLESWVRFHLFMEVDRAQSLWRYIAKTH